MTQKNLFKFAALSVGIPPADVEKALDAYDKMRAGNDDDAVLQQYVQILKGHFDFNSPPGKAMTATECCAAVGIENPTRSEQMRMGRALAIVTMRRGRKSNGRVIYTLPSVTLP